MKVPFQVMCVNCPADWRELLPSIGCTYPEVFDECTVTGTEKHMGHTMYFLAEHPGVSFRSIRFATLPEQSADEMQEEKHESIINIETQPV
jgi:hypothetical protein